MDGAAARLALRFAPGAAKAASSSPAARFEPRGPNQSSPRVRNDSARTGRAESFLAGGEGFEPPLTESESVVLPLDDPPGDRPGTRRLTLGVLGGLAGLVQTDLLALHSAGIAGDEAGLA